MLIVYSNQALTVLINLSDQLVQLRGIERFRRRPQDLTGGTGRTFFVGFLFRHAELPIPVHCNRRQLPNRSTTRNPL